MSEYVHTFAGNPLDRGEALRRDEQAIAELLQRPDSCFLPFAQLRVAMDENNRLVWLDRAALEQLNPQQLIFLGLHDGQPCFAAQIEPADCALTFEDCRNAAAQLQTFETGIVAQARALLDWHRRSRFCAECGNPSQPERGGQIRRCTVCGKHIFPRTDPVAIMLITDGPGGDHCLLGQSRGRMANTNFYSALAGFLDAGESLEDAVRREVWEEAGIRVGHVQYHSSQPWPFPSQLMIGCHGIATTQQINMDTAEMADVRWFSRDEAMRAIEGRNENLRVPGELAIAHHLIRCWVSGEVEL